MRFLLFVELVMKNTASPLVQQESAHLRTIFSETDTNILMCNLEHVFVNSTTRRANEHVFLLTLDGLECIRYHEGRFISGVPAATAEVNRLSRQLLLAAGGYLCSS
jgi:uncharacterized protein (UPF0276 family)